MFRSPIQACLLLVLLGCQSEVPQNSDAVIEQVASNLIFASPQEAGFSPEALSAAVDTIRRAVDDGRMTGVQVLVARGGKVVAHEAFGLRDLDQRLPMEKTSLLRMASTTKTFVATGVVLLAQDGLLDIDDPVSTYLPGFSEGLSAKITIRDLLRHTSGFAYTYTNYVGDVTMASEEFPDAPSMIVEAVKIGREGPEVEPGTRCQYTNWAYTVLGGLLEQVSGQKLDAFLNERLYLPLGMTDTSHDLFGVDSSRISLSYQMSDGAWEIIPPESPPFARGTGGLVSTALDYAKFAQLFLDGGVVGSQRILNSLLVDEATSVQAECPFLYMGPEDLVRLGVAEPWQYKRDRRDLGLDIGYGLGWAVAANGSFGHTGFRGLYSLVDPNENLIILLFAQSRVGGTPGQEFVDASMGRKKSRDAS
jgi:CubicO group peptidase (beta-lactamase class C family)